MLKSIRKLSSDVSDLDRSHLMSPVVGVQHVPPSARVHDGI